LNLRYVVEEKLPLGTLRSLLKVTLSFVAGAPLGIATSNVVPSIGVPVWGFVKLPPNQDIGVPGVEVAFGCV
jgi:hypothetical protein